VFKMTCVFILLCLPGKGNVVQDSEVVLTKMKIFQNFSEKLCVSEDSFSTSSSMSVCEQEAPQLTRTSEENPHLNEGPGSPSEQAPSDYLCGIFSDAQLPRLYKFESEDSGVELPSGANSPSTPTGSEQSFVVHSRGSSCDSCRLNTSAPVTDERVSPSEAGETEEKQTTGTPMGTPTRTPTDANGGNDNEEDEDTLCTSTMAEEKLSFCVERTDVTLVEGLAEASCGDALDGSPDPDPQVVGSEPRADVEKGEEVEEKEEEEEEEEEVRPSDQPPVEFREDGEEEDVFRPMTSSLRKSSTSESLEEYMDECCRLSEVGHTLML